MKENPKQKRQPVFVEEHKIEHCGTASKAHSTPTEVASHPRFHTQRTFRKKRSHHTFTFTVRVTVRERQREIEHYHLQILSFYDISISKFSGCRFAQRSSMH